jgi:hypothetical protein
LFSPVDGSWRTITTCAPTASGTRDKRRASSVCAGRGILKASPP